MKVQEVLGLDQKIYTETLENGLTVYLIPFPNRKNYHIDYVTKFGSINTTFIPYQKKDFVEVPHGVAHFLEHKMFEQENGVDPFQYFSQSGSDANASTGYQTTSYTVDGTSDFNGNLDYLLTYVNSPYFTEENVEKEKNIIIEEINMYSSEAESRLYEESNKAVFKYHPVRLDIGGTEKSVRKITKENLYDCYHIFYQPSNMILFAAGAFEVDEVLETIKNNQALNKKITHQEIIEKKVKEPISVYKKEKVIYLENILIPKFILTFKIPIHHVKKEQRYEYATKINMLVSILFGSSSSFREELSRLGLMCVFSVSKAIIDDFLLIEFTSEADKPEEVKNQLIKWFEERPITKEDVERMKKVCISEEVWNSDKAFPSLLTLKTNVLEFGNPVYDRLEIVRRVTLDDILNVRREIDFHNCSFAVGYPKEQKPKRENKGKRK